MILLYILVYSLINADMGPWCDKRLHTYLCKQRLRDSMSTKVFFYHDKNAAVKDYHKYSGGLSSLQLYEVRVSSYVAVKQITPPAMQCEPVEKDIGIYGEKKDLTR